VGSTLGTIQQSFATTAGQRYSLAFLYSHNPVDVVGGATVSARVQVLGGGTLLDQTISHTAGTPTTNFLNFFIADSASTTVRFTALTQQGTGGIVLDAVQVNEATTVPEPTSLAILGFGLLAVAVYVRQC